MDIINDMRLVFATLSILFRPESTEGVAAEQKTAMEPKAVDLQKILIQE